ncbi:MAG: SMC-Scp complex subunit ScpB [Actinomycetia bacterium]|nr:SMC-Scp complex subunit ScpB [Actinomycetes bacterium]
MTTNTDRGALEALLFVSDEPVSAADLAQILERTEAEVADMLEALGAEYAHDERGFQLREVAGGWRLYTHPAYHDLIEGYVLSWDTRRLSQAALEALAVIAYHQPVTRAGVAAVRGVNSEAVIASLIEKGLVRETGRDKRQGNAILYSTTQSFLEKFGLKDISGLPPLEDFAPDEESEAAIRLRLGAGASAADALSEDEDEELLYGSGDEETLEAPADESEEVEELD